MKIVWHSVAPWVGTGYGQQTGQATPRIKALGHDIAISAYYGLWGGVQRWRGMNVYPGYAKGYGKDTLIPHALHHFGAEPGASFGEVSRRGLIITLGDVWTFDIPLLPGMNVAAWVPVDHETVPLFVRNWLENSGAIPIAMSRFGQRKLEEIGLSPLYVPHGIDTAVFHPGDKIEARKRIGLPEDAFVVAMVAANVGTDGARKAFYEQILAFSELRKKHSDAVLALHTDIAGPLGMDLGYLLEDLGLPASSYLATDQYAYRVGVPAETVADIYRAADVLTNTSWGEGFGIPIVEAQACGTPVVVTDTTAMPELVGAGWKVAGEPLWHDSQKAWARRPLISGIIDAYHEAYEHARSDVMRAQAWTFAQDYDADVVFDAYWQPALKQLEEAVDGRLAAAKRPPDPDSLEMRIRSAGGFLWVERGNRTDDWIGWSSHEDSLQSVIEGLLPEGGVFVDVGAHIGRWTVRMAGRCSRVYAVEPNPAALVTLRQHLALNNIDNVTVIELAAWDAEATLELDDPNHRLAGGSTRTLMPGDTWRNAKEGETPGQLNPVLVNAGRLDAVSALVKLDRLDLIKLDVEGSDLHALRGMAELLTRYRPALLVECHDRYGYYTTEDLDEVLTELGYGWEFVYFKDAPYRVCRRIPGW
jgi:FkbM family methyltransferase